MKNIYILILISLVIWSFSSCADEKLIQEEETSIGCDSYDEEGEPLNVFVEDMSLRTRDVDFSEETTLRINTFWLGVFDYPNGRCVAKYDGSMGYAFVSSGTLSQGLIRHKLSAPTGTNTGQYFMVALVNYQGVQGRWSESPDNLHDLSQMLQQVDTWQKFNSIGIDTNSAYGDQNNDHSNDAPMMAGFLNAADYDPTSPSSVHVKIDQFQQTDNKVALSPTPTTSNFLFSYSNGKYNISDKVLFLRRLVSNFQFNISFNSENIEIKDVNYKKFNIPSSVYIIERSMLATQAIGGNAIGKFPTNADYSPNFADGYPALGYSSDSNPLHVSTNLNSEGKISFSFQHFANKHWARNEVNTYPNREDFTMSNGKKIFKALTSESDPDDFNNYASYVELTMRIIDKRKNCNALVTYTIHEGFTSYDDGSEVLSGDARYNEIFKDFSCARNRNYIYNIDVQGFDNVSFNVNGKKVDNVWVDDNGNKYDPHITAHRPDQAGKEWRFHYIGETVNKENGSSDFGYDAATNSFKKYLSGNGGEHNDVFSLKSASPVIAFRIYGYDSNNQKIEGYNFSFLDSSFDNLEGMWPDAIPNAGGHYFQDYNALIHDYILGERIEDIKDYIFMESDELKQELLSYLEPLDKSIESKLFDTFKLKVSDNPENASKDKIVTINIPMSITRPAGNDIEEKTWNFTFTKEIDMTKYHNVVEFMMFVDELRQGTGERLPLHYSISVDRRDYDKIKDAKPYTNEGLMRCFYITDRNGTTDQDGCSTVVDVIAAIQGIQQ